MKILLVLIWAFTTLADDSLEDILKSHQKTFKFYQEFKHEHNLHYQPEDDSARLLHFIKSAQLVDQLNSDASSSANFALNEFSTLSSSEKQEFLGLNITGGANPAPAVAPDLTALPERKLWTDEGAVTRVERQRDCRSSWAFAASNALDTQYKIATGILRNFAEQEFLDCVYSFATGCQGGFYNDAYQYSLDSGRLGFNRWDEYSYFAHSCLCEVSKKRDALIAAKLTSYVKVGGIEESTIEALSHSAVSAAFEATDAFMQYERGTLQDQTCTSVPNHAVTLVGYTKTFVLGKNSWGSKWGEDGFVKFARHHDNCHLWRYASYPVLTKTAESDVMGEDEPVVYNATKYEPHDNCANFTDKIHSKYCRRDSCDGYSASKLEDCKATCNNCRVKYKFGPVHKDCAKFTDTMDTCDRIRCFKADEHYLKGTCKATCNNCPVPIKTIDPHPDCANFTDTQPKCKFEECYKNEDYRNRKCKGTCNHCKEPVKFGPVHPDCPYMTDIWPSCNKWSCFTASEFMLKGACVATCNNCPVPVKTPKPHPGCANFTNIQPNCKFEICYRHEEYRNKRCKGTCHHCTEPVKFGPVHPDCSKFTDTITNCDRYACFAGDELYLEGRCKATCNNCPVPIKTLDPHPDCANFTDTYSGCELKYCYGSESYRNEKCKGTCNHCKEPIKLGPVHPDCPRFTDYSTNCDRMKCFRYNEYYTEGKCKATCNNCPVPIKEVPAPHPGCANFTDTVNNCQQQLQYCYRSSTLKKCMGSCNHCKEPVKFGPVHPDCAQFTDAITGCDKFQCLKGREHYNLGQCKGTCNNCPVPMKTLPPHPECAKFNDVKTSCKLEWCYKESDRRACMATCNHCKIKMKPHPDCPNMVDVYTNCQKSWCANSNPKWMDELCRWTCHNCDM